MFLGRVLVTRATLHRYTSKIMLIFSPDGSRVIVTCILCIACGGIYLDTAIGGDLKRNRKRNR